MGGKSLFDTVKESVLWDVGELSVHDYHGPVVGVGALLLEMDLCGVCGTDIHLYGGNMKVLFPVIPGHEYTGWIKEMGEGAESLGSNDPFR